jgi:hypothetical protein
VSLWEAREGGSGLGLLWEEMLWILNLILRKVYQRLTKLMCSTFIGKKQKTKKQNN